MALQHMHHRFLGVVPNNMQAVGLGHVPQLQADLHECKNVKVHPTTHDYDHQLQGAQIALNLTKAQAIDLL